MYFCVCVGMRCLKLITPQTGKSRIYCLRPRLWQLRFACDSSASHWVARCSGDYWASQPAGRAECVGDRVRTHQYLDCLAVLARLPITFLQQHSLSEALGWHHAVGRIPVSAECLVPNTQLVRLGHWCVGCRHVVYWFITAWGHLNNSQCCCRLPLTS